jgi:hypothetical protein
VWETERLAQEAVSDRGKEKAFALHPEEQRQKTKQTNKQKQRLRQKDT